jgi:hypothetical protein
MRIEHLQDMCQTFVSIPLATLSAGGVENRMVALHELQLQSCVEQCCRARNPSLNSPPTFLKEVSVWQRSIIVGLSAKTTVPVDMNDSTDIDYGATFTDEQDMAAIADAVLQSFLGLALEPESAPDDYLLGIWCDTFVGTRRVCLCWRWVLWLLIDVSSYR